MKRLMAFRVGSTLAFLGLALSFVLALVLDDPTPFTVVGGAAVGGKWMESTAQRWRENTGGDD